MILMSGCGAFTEKTVTVDVGCYWIKPIQPTRAEFISLTRQTREQIVAHNESWKHNCGQFQVLPESDLNDR